MSNRTTSLFDAVGNLTTLKDGDNNVSTFAYDALNRKTSQGASSSTCGTAGAA